MDKYAARVEWHLGAGKDRHGRTILPEDRQRIKAEALAYFARMFGGVSITDQTGAWRDPSGSIVVEEGITVVAYADSSAMADPAARFLLERADQECCLVAIFYATPGGFTVREVWRAADPTKPPTALTLTEPTARR